MIVLFQIMDTNHKTHEQTLKWYLTKLYFLVFVYSCHSIHTMEHEFYECPEYLSNIPAEVERTEDYEYEVGFCIILQFERNLMRYVFALQTICAQLWSRNIFIGMQCNGAQWWFFNMLLSYHIQRRCTMSKLLNIICIGIYQPELGSPESCIILPLMLFISSGVLERMYW